MDLSPGSLVTPSLRLARPLGEGGMGSVWVADHLTLRTEVAVKFVLPSRAEKDPGAISRFRLEASLAARIKSPHVVQIFDHGTTPDGTPFIVMELLRGESLADRLDRRATLTLREAGLFVAQVAEVLARAHELGVVHRDIKPANLFLIESGYELFVKVLDFGVAKETGLLGEIGMTSTGAIVGTPRYMSPEQILDAKTADHRADLWGLAVVAYQVLTGALPFQGETLARLSLAIHKGTFTPPSEIRPGLPLALDDWFTRALAIEPAARFASAAEMADTFHRLVLAWGEDVEGAPTEPAFATPPPSPGSPPPAWVAAGADVTQSDEHSSLGGGTMRVQLDEAPEATSAPEPARAASGPHRTFSGASSTLDSARGPRRRPSGAAMGGLVAIVVLSAAALFSTRGPSSPAREVSASGAPASGAASAALHATIGMENMEEAPVAAVDPAAPPSLGSAAPASGHAASAPARSTAVRRPSASARPDCKQPYNVDAEGILHVKPECL